MWIGISLEMAVYLVFGIAPAIGNAVISLTNYSGLIGAPTNFTGLANYTALFTTQRPGFVSSLFETLYFVVGVTVVQNVFAMLMAHRLQGDSKGSSFLRILVFVPIVLGVTVVGLIWLLLFDPSTGPAAIALHHVGVQSAFFGSNSWAMPLVIIVQVWQNLGFTMVVFIGGLRAIPRDVYEAASMDGITRFRQFTKITWPLMAPSVTVNVLFAVIGSLTTYNLIYVLTTGLYNTNTLGMFSFNSAFGSSANLGLGAAVTTILLIITVLVAIPVAALLRTRERRILN
jgi:raffinose/stachyose/melibiose transport system permease protein